jgi:hypothetical protein
VVACFERSRNSQVSSELIADWLLIARFASCFNNGRGGLNVVARQLGAGLKLRTIAVESAHWPALSGLSVAKFALLPIQCF